MDNFDVNNCQIVVDDIGHFHIHGRLQPKVVVAGFISQQKATRTYQPISLFECQLKDAKN